eukprot:EG_transcript_3433
MAPSPKVAKHMSQLLLSTGITLHLPSEAGESATVLFRQFLDARSEVNSASPAELPLELLHYLVNADALAATGRPGVIFLEALVNLIHTEVFNRNDVHCFDASILVVVSREALLASWYRALALLAAHDVPAPCTSSALLSAAAGGTVRLAVTFGGQGKVWLPLLRHLWDVYRPVVQPFLDRMAQALTHAVNAPDVCTSPHLSHGLDFLGWLRDPPPPDPYLLSSPVTAPMTAVLQLAHVWVCWHCLGVPLQELQRRITGATGHSLGLVSAVVLAAADSESSFLECSAVGVTLLFRVGLRGLEAYQVAATAAVTEAGATPLLSVAHATLPQVQRYLQAANAHLPAHDHLEVALINGPKLIVVAGHPSHLLNLAATLRTDSVEAATRFSTSFVPSSAPFHSSHLKDAVAVVKQDIGDLGLRFPHSGAFPVYSTADGTPILFDENLPLLLANLLIVKPVDWVRCAGALDATHILDFGPPGMALLTQRNRGGDGITVIAASELVPPAAAVPSKAALFDTRDVVAWGTNPDHPPSSLTAGGPDPRKPGRPRPRPSNAAHREWTPEEVSVRHHWAELLDVPEGSLAADESFFTVGGHSLLATDLAGRLGVDLATLLRCPTIAQQARVLGPARREAALPALLAGPDQAAGPTTFQQRQIYLHGQATGASYEVPFSWEVAATVAEVDAVLAAVPELRTAFALGQDGQLEQAVRLAAPRVEVLAEGAGEAELRAWRRSVRLDVHEGPVCRVAAVPLSPLPHSEAPSPPQPPRLLVAGVAHHLVADGLGLDVLRRHMVERCTTPTSPSYLDYARWQVTQLDQLGDSAALRPDLAGAE